MVDLKYLLREQQSSAPAGAAISVSHVSQGSKATLGWTPKSLPGFISSGFLQLPLKSKRKCVGIIF